MNYDGTKMTMNFFLIIYYIQIEIIRNVDFFGFWEGNFRIFLKLSMIWFLIVFSKWKLLFKLALKSASGYFAKVSKFQLNNYYIIEHIHLKIL